MARRRRATWERWLRPRSWAARADARASRAAGEPAPSTEAMASASAPLKRSGSTPFTSTAASSTSSWSRSRSWRSIVSLTGISSASATATTEVRAGSVTNSWIRLAWLRIGPTRAISA